jgi:hypothetical protein
MSESYGRGPGPDEASADRCADCGEELDTATERSFAVGADATLCFRCAVARGGSWDESSQRWVVEPDHADLGEGFD